jgi:hypothetical protein
VVHALTSEGLYVKQTEALRHVVADINAIDKELEQLHRLKQLAEAVKIDSKNLKSGIAEGCVHV